MRRSRVKNLAIASALALSALVISLLIVLKFILPAQVRGYLERFSENTGYKVKVGDIDFGLFSGFRGSEIEISNPLNIADPILTVGRLVFEPAILASILDLKIKIQEIVIEKPVFSLDKRELDGIINLMGDRGDDKKSFPIEVRRLQIRDARIARLPQVEIKQIALALADAPSEEDRAINIQASIAALGNEVSIVGVAYPFSPAPSGEVKITIPRLVADTVSVAIARGEFSLSSRFAFRIADGVTSQGEIDLRRYEGAPAGEGRLAGKIRYEAKYDPKTDAASLDSLIFEADELISASFWGAVRGVKTGGIFDIQGRIDPIQLENLPRFIPALSSVQMSGLILTDYVKLSGSPAEATLALTVGGRIAGGDIRSAESGYFIQGIEGEFTAEKPLSEPAEDFAARASLRLKSAETLHLGKSGGAQGRVAFTSRQGIGGALSLVDFEASALGGRVNLGGKYTFSAASRSIAGRLSASNLDLNKIPGDSPLAGIRGIVDSLDAGFESRDMDEFTSEASFEIRDFKLRLESGEGLSISKADAPLPVRISLSKTGGGIKIGAPKLRLAKVSYGEIHAEKADGEKLEFNLERGGEWTTEISVNGAALRIPQEQVSLGQFRGLLRGEGGGSGRLSFSGSVAAERGEFKTLIFPALSSDFKYQSGSVALGNLKAELERYGEISAQKLELLLGNKEQNIPYRLGFAGADFKTLGGRVYGGGVKGDFNFYSAANEIRWSANLSAEEIATAFMPIKKLSARVKSFESRIEVEAVSGEFMGGSIGGGASVRVAESSPIWVDSRLRLDGASFASGGINFALESVGVDFAGELGEGLLPKGGGKIGFRGLDIKQGGVSSSSLRGEIELEASGETLSIKSGFIEESGGEGIKLIGAVENPLNDNRSFAINLPRIPMAFLKNALSPVIPAFADGALKGDLSLSLTSVPPADETESGWRGSLKITDVSFESAANGGAGIRIGGVNGAITLRDTVKSQNPFFTIAKSPKLYKTTFDDFLEFLNAEDAKAPSSGGDFLRIREIEYGFFRIEDIECELELSGGGLNLKRLESKLYGGEAFATGGFDFAPEGLKYNLSLLFSRVSLDKISGAVPSGRDYITGRVNGISWLKGESGDLNAVDGSFNLWAIGSSEPRKIGKALLQKLGVKEKLVLRSARKYNNGQIYGYMKDGFITFKKLELSRGILGLKDLSISVDSKRNSISLSHFLSVMRETTKRASEGDLQIEFEKKNREVN
ncbi:MAG: hypothetical protein ACT4NX_08370 [Deltaproteobacteria bacterium]